MGGCCMNNTNIKKEKGTEVALSMISEETRNDESGEFIAPKKVHNAHQTHKCANTSIDLFDQYCEKLPLENSNTQLRLESMGPYDYAQSINAKDKNLELKDLRVLPDGSTYVGYWSVDSSLQEGKGMQHSLNGSRYEGSWKGGKYGGRGRLIHPDGSAYEGDFENDLADGFGVYTANVNGASYVGEWKDNEKNGKGMESWKDGSKFEGNFMHGKKHGKGYFKWADNSEYKGDFYNNEIQGNGIYTWNDGRKFDGEWVNNKMNGFGVFTWPDGKKYTGNYVEDIKEGDGKFEWEDGKIYQGNWHNGKQNGIGVVFSVQKSAKRKGIWKSGRRTKWIT